MTRLLRAFGAALLALAPAPAQETRGMIHGRVLDPQSGAVAGAAVTVVSTDTNTAVRLKTNDTGYYEANLLIPGNYRVQVEASGFKRYVRDGIVLPVGTRLEVPVALEVGAVTESVSVTAEAPLLDTSAVSAGRVVDNRSLMDLPTPSNNPMVLGRLAPGIQHAGAINYDPAHAFGASQFYLPGRVGGNDFAIDGLPNLGPSRNAAFNPYSDTLQEFKIETANFDAGVGNNAGASVTMLTKSGSNSFHGTLTEQHWQQRWNGSSFFVRQLYYNRIAAAEAAGNTALAAQLRSEDRQPSGHSNQYAATIGGPVLIPKLFNGRDKLFFFFSFNGYREPQAEPPNAINRTVPTPENLQGDFSQLLRADAVRYQIHDPLTVRTDPARPRNFIRTPFPGNLIPQSRFQNPAYGYYSKLIPRPNNPPASANLEPVNNYLSVGAPLNRFYDAYTNRVDYNRSERHRFFGRWSWSHFLRTRGDWTYETAPGLHEDGLIRRNVGGTFDWVYTHGAATLVNFTAGVNQFREGNIYDGARKIRPSETGLPAYLDAKAGDQPILPLMGFSGYQNISFDGVPAFNRYRVATAKAELSHIRGVHTLRTGFDARHHFRTGGGGGNTSGNFQFNNFYTRRNDDTLTPAGDLGHSWAAFLMGLPSSMAVETNDSFALHSPHYAAFVQENWRVTKRLTLNLGLRLEYEQGISERFNRVIGWFDPQADTPIAGASQAAYARSPIPELSAANFSVRGGSVYPGVGGQSRRVNRNEWMWMPRAGFAWQLNPRTVMRGGYGMYFDTINPLNVTPDTTGFSRATATIVTNDFGVNWLAGNPRAGVSPLTDPFPVRADGTRFDTPPRDGLGVMARTGRGWTFTDFDTRRARQQRWRFGLQRQFGASLMVEAAYAGAHSDRIALNQPLSYLPKQFWATGMVRNNDIANNLNSNVANPFAIGNFLDLARTSPLVYQDLRTQGFFTSPTVRKNQLLRRFPHMNGLVNSGAPLGRARSHALELSVERRFAKGFNLNAAYTRMRLNEADFFYNEFDQDPSWQPSNDGRPHRIVASGIWELPFGRGRRFLASGPGNRILGGFQISLTWEFQPGALINWGNLFYYGNLADIAQGERTLDRWFNTDNFERVAARAPAAFHERVFPTRIESLRQDLTNYWSGNVQREFKFLERIRLQLRLDALNLFNRSQFNPPVVNPVATNFGRITNVTAQSKRWIQIQARIRF